MAKRQLDYTVRINKTGASANLRSLGREMDAVAVKHERMARQLRQGSIGMTNAARGMDRMNRSGKQLGSTLSNSFTKSGKSLFSLNRFLKDTGAQLGNVARMAKRAVFYIGAIGGAVAYKGLSNYAGFQEQMNLLITSLNPGQMNNTPAGIEMRGMIEQTLKNNAIATGQNLTEITRAQNQAFSSGIWGSIRNWLGNDEAMTEPDKAKYGFVGKNVSYNEAYVSKMNESAEIVKNNALFATATGADVQRMNDVMTTMANLLGMDKEKLTDTAYIRELMAGTLDTGVGWMEDFQNQFSKFWASSKLAGSTPAESLSLFARLTKTNNPEMAGFISNSIFTDIAQGPQKSIGKARKIGRGILSNLGLEPGEYSDERKKLRSLKIEEFSLRAGGTITERDKALLERFANPQTWTDIYMNKAGERRPVTDVIQRVGGLFGGSLQMTDAGQAVLDAAIGTEVNVRKGIAQLADEGFEDYKTILAVIGDSSEAVKKLNADLANGIITQDQWAKKLEASSFAAKKVDDTLQGFSFQWKQLGVNMNIVSSNIGEALSPALMAVNEVMSKGTDSTEEFNRIINEGFAEAAERIEKMIPGMGNVVELLGKGVKFMGSKEGKEFASSMMEGVAALFRFAGELASLFGKISGTLSNIMGFAGALPLLTVPATMIGYAGTHAFIRQLGAGVVGVFSGGAVRTAAARSGIGAAIGGSLTTWLRGGAALTIGMLIGNSIGNSIVEKVQEARDDFKNLLATATGAELGTGAFGAGGGAFVEYAKKHGGLGLGDVEEFLLAGGVKPTTGYQSGYGSGRISMSGTAMRALELVGLGNRREEVASKLIGLVDAWSKSTGMAVPEAVKADLLGFGEPGAVLAPETAQFMSAIKTLSPGNLEGFKGLLSDPAALQDPLVAENLRNMQENIRASFGNEFLQQQGLQVNIQVQPTKGKELTEDDFTVVLNTGAGGSPQKPASSMDFSSAWSGFKAANPQLKFAK